MTLQAKGSNAYLAQQQEGVFGVAPATPNTTKIYFATESIGKSQGQEKSAIITGNRNPTKPTRGDIDTAGDFNTELMASLGGPLYGVLGSVATTANSGAGEVLGDALTVTSAVIDPYAQTLTVTSTAHGVTLGAVILIEGLDAPTVLNDLYCQCILVTSADVFVLRIPTGVSTTFTIGAGTLKPVTTAATTYKHTLKVGACLPSFLLEKGFPDINVFFKESGITYSRLSFDATSKGPQNITFGLMGADETVATSPFDATPTDLGKASFDGLSLGTIEEGGVASATVSAITGLTFSNNLDGDTYVLGGAGKRSGINPGEVDVSGTLKALFTGAEFYTKAVNGTESALRLVYSRGTGAGTLGNESIEFKIPELVYSVKTPPVSKPGGLWVELPFTAFFSASAEATAMQIIIKSPQIAI